jgi:nucleotide-binding universal stress UspA family protein
MLRNILVPLDGSTLSERALPYAAELAPMSGARLTLVRASRVHHHLHLGPPDEHPDEAATYMRAQAESLRRDGLVVDTVARSGEPPPALLTEIERQQPDLVVMGTHGRSGLGRWVYGSVTEGVVGHARQPVLLVPTRSSQPRRSTPRCGTRPNTRRATTSAA